MRRRGFTLIEAVVAAAVVGCALVWLMAASRYAVRANGAASDRMKAAALALGMIEEIQSEGEFPLRRRGAFETAPGIRWELSRRPASGPSDVPGLHEGTLQVVYPGAGAEDERTEYVFLFHTD